MKTIFRVLAVSFGIQMLVFAAVLDFRCDEIREDRKMEASATKSALYMAASGLLVFGFNNRRS